MGMNISAGFAGLANGLSQMANLQAQREATEIAQVRAENLARLKNGMDYMRQSQLQKERQAGDLADRTQEIGLEQQLVGKRQSANQARTFENQRQMQTRDFANRRSLQDRSLSQQAQYRDGAQRARDLRQAQVQRQQATKDLTTAQQQLTQYVQKTYPMQGIDQNGAFKLDWLRDHGDADPNLAAFKSRIADAHGRLTAAQTYIDQNSLQGPGSRSTDTSPLTSPAQAQAPLISTDDTGGDDEAPSIATAPSDSYNPDDYAPATEPDGSGD